MAQVFVWNRANIVGLVMLAVHFMCDRSHFSLFYSLVYSFRVCQDGTCHLEI